MSVFCCVFSVVQIAQLHVLPFGEDRSSGFAPEAFVEDAVHEHQPEPSLLLSLGLAVLLHLLLFVALTAEPVAKRGSEAGFFEAELWPGFQVQLVAEPAAPLPEPARPALLRLEAPDAEVDIEKKAPPQQKRVGPEYRVPEQLQRGDEKRQEGPEQPQGCPSPEEMARLEQNRRSDTDAPSDGRPPEVGSACAAG